MTKHKRSRQCGTLSIQITMNDALAILRDTLIRGHHSELEQLQLLVQKYGPFDLGNELTFQSSSLIIDVLDNSDTQDSQFDGDDFIFWLQSNATLNLIGNGPHTKESNETTTTISRDNNAADSEQPLSTEISPGKPPPREGNANVTRPGKQRDQPAQGDTLPTKPPHLQGDYSSITLVSGDSAAKFTFPTQTPLRRAHRHNETIVNVARVADWIVIRTEAQHIAMPAEDVPDDLTVGSIVEFVGIDERAGQRLRLVDGAEVIKDEAINSPPNDDASSD